MIYKKIEKSSNLEKSLKDLFFEVIQQEEEEIKVTMIVNCDDKYYQVSGITCEGYANNDYYDFNFFEKTKRECIDDLDEKQKIDRGNLIHQHIQEQEELIKFLN